MEAKQALKATQAAIPEVSPISPFIEIINRSAANLDAAITLRNRLNFILSTIRGEHPQTEEPKDLATPGSSFIEQMKGAGEDLDRALDQIAAQVTELSEITG